MLWIAGLVVTLVIVVVAMAYVEGNDGLALVIFIGGIMAYFIGSGLYLVKN